MKINKNYNYFLYITITIILIYLWTIFTKIHYDPNYVMKGHHDYRFRGFLIFGIYVFGWFFFVLGLYQLKYYLRGNNTLLLLTIIYSCLIGYVFYLLFEGNTIELSSVSSGRFRKSMAIIIPSLIILIFSWTKYAKLIHLESKLQNLEKNNFNK
jgi:amino acid transporter